MVFNVTFDPNKISYVTIFHSAFLWKVSISVEFYSEHFEIEVNNDQNDQNIAILKVFVWAWTNILGVFKAK